MVEPAGNVKVNPRHYFLPPSPEDKKRHTSVADYPSPCRNFHHSTVVEKPWGYEFLLFDNGEASVWLLHITTDHRTSLHCHLKKRTCLAMLSGLALCRTLNTTRFLSPGDTVSLDKGVFHSTMALSPGGIYLIEIETPPIKTDLVRIDDLYSRRDSRYEEATEFTEEEMKNRFNWFVLDDEPTYSHFGLSVEPWPCSTKNALLWPLSGNFAGVLATEAVLTGVAKGTPILRCQNYDNSY